MACIYSNAVSPRRYFGDISQLTNWILESGATCHMTPDIYVFTPVSMVETNEYIEGAYRCFLQQNKQDLLK